MGEYINISLYQNIDGEKQYQGFLKELTDDELTLTVKIKTRTKDMVFDRKNIAKGAFCDRVFSK